MQQYKRIHIFVSGKVQGVYFRQNALHKAEELNVYGWIKNLDDGRVESIFEGLDQNLSKMVEWCKQGPENALVDKIEIMDEPYKGEFSNFRILPTN